MKRNLIALMLSLVMMVSITGCRNNTQNGDDINSSSTSTSSTTSTTSETGEMYVDDDGNIIDSSTGETVSDGSVTVDEDGNIVDTETGETVVSKEESDHKKEEIKNPSNSTSSGSSSSSSSKPTNPNGGNTTKPTNPPTGSNSDNSKPTEPPKDTTPPTTTPDDPKHTHKWEYYYTISGPFCDRDGVNAEKCFACGETREVPNKERVSHSFDSWVNEKIATPTETGLKTRKCFNCEYKEKKTVAKVNWKPVDGNLSLEMQKYVNQNRQANGLPALKYRYDLQKYADLRAKESFTKYSHTRPDGRSWETVFTDNGLELLGIMAENISGDDTDAKTAVEGFMNSPGHRANILLPNTTGVVTGVYYHVDKDTGQKTFWTVHFYVTDELG